MDETAGGEDEATEDGRAPSDMRVGDAEKDAVGLRSVGSKGARDCDEMTQVARSVAASGGADARRRLVGS